MEFVNPKAYSLFWISIGISLVYFLCPPSLNSNPIVYTFSFIMAFSTSSLLVWGRLVELSESPFSFPPFLLSFLGVHTELFGYISHHNMPFQIRWTFWSQHLYTSWTSIFTCLIGLTRHYLIILSATTPILPNRIRFTSAFNTNHSTLFLVHS